MRGFILVAATLGCAAVLLAQLDFVPSSLDVDPLFHGWTKLHHTPDELNRCHQSAIESSNRPALRPLSIDGFWRNLTSIVVAYSELAYSLVTDTQFVCAFLGLPPPTPADLDPHCADSATRYFRQLDGSCNDIRNGKWDTGMAGTTFQRDCDQPECYTYADGINEPRRAKTDARTVSLNIYTRVPEDQRPKIPQPSDRTWEKTPFLVGFLQFLMHDTALSMPGDETYRVGPDGMLMNRSAAVPGHWDGPTPVPRETINYASTWFDASAVYGTDAEVTDFLREHQGGRMRSQVGPDGYEYLPYNTAHNGKKSPIMMQGGGPERQKHLFVAGDWRANMNYWLLTMHTLMLREHNRLAGKIAAQHPDWSDTKLFQAARHVLASKVSSLATHYMMQYQRQSMFGPQDGLSLPREYFAKMPWQIGSMTTVPYPFKYCLRGDGRLRISSNEMDINYRWHVLLPDEVEFKNEANRTFRVDGVRASLYNTSTFLNEFNSIARGMSYTKLPDFHAGVPAALQNMSGFGRDPEYRKQFDIAAWTIGHERERGLPTYNRYCRWYNKWSSQYNEKGFLPVPKCIEKRTFEEFAPCQPDLVAKLREMYDHVDEVDLSVGSDLDELFYPGMSIPRNFVITNLASLFSTGMADRFSPAYSVPPCSFKAFMLPFWPCYPTNALEELLYEPRVQFKLPPYNLINEDWLDELDVFRSGENVFWRMILQNTPLKCIQKNPFDLPDPVTNPMVDATGSPDNCLQPPPA